MVILRQGVDLRYEDTEFLKSNNHTFRVLTNKAQGAPGASGMGGLLRRIAQPSLVIIFTVLYYCITWYPISLLCGAVALTLVALRITCVVVLFAGIIAGKLHKARHRKSLRYWCWWPVWSLLLCLACALYGHKVGNYLWDCCTEPWWQMRRLQNYKDVDPGVMSGSQIQDAGLVDFANGVDLDRSKGGCFVNDGHTYCIAPILQGGELRNGLANAPAVGAYDFFAVGIDCCTCPNQNFQCGQWNNPLARGGARSMDTRSRPSYKLAVDQWSATYNKPVKHALFFDWVQDPVFYFNAGRQWALQVAVLAVATPILILCGLVFIIDAVRQLLVWNNISDMADTPAPPRGFEKAWARFLPGMLKHSLDEHRQMLGLPVQQAPNYQSGGTAALPPTGNR